MNKFIIDSNNKSVAQVIANCVTFIRNLPSDKRWAVEVKPYKLNRSNPQNSYLWGVVYKTIVEQDASFFFSEQTEANIARYKIKHTEVVHEFFKAKYLPIIDVNGAKVTPSTTKLSTADFTDYVESIMRFASMELGIYIPSPSEKGLTDYKKWWGGR